MPVVLRWLLSLGPLNPIAVRIIASGSRRPRHALIRSAYLGVLILVLLYSLLTLGSSLSYGALAQRGAAAFANLAYLQIVLIAVLAPLFMAGAIAKESNPRTWEILLTTPLSPAQIVLGHLWGRLFFIFALLLAVLPLLALTQYFGGVPGTTILASLAVSAATALVVGAIAIMLCVLQVGGKRVVFGFYVAVVTYLTLTIAADGFLRSRGMGVGPAGSGVTVMTGLNPLLALTALLDPTGYPRAEPGSVAGVRGLLLTHPTAAWCLGSVLLSAACVLVSTFRLRMAPLRDGSGALGGVFARLRARRGEGAGEGGESHRAPGAVWHNPIAWREASARNASPLRLAARWGFVGLGLLLGVALIALYHTGTLTLNDFRFALLAALWGETAVITLIAVSSASSAISREREDGTLDLLLTTPITPSQYLAGKLRGLVTFLLPMLLVPVGTLALCGLYVLFDALGRAGGAWASTPIAGGASVSVPLVLPEGALLAAVVMIPFVALCVMVGLHWSLRSKGSIGAVVGAVAVLGVIYGTLGLCGWKAGADLPAVGPALAALAPSSLLYALVGPDAALTASLSPTLGAGGARIALAIGACVGAVLCGVGVYSVHAAMVRTFDVTVRRLAGTG